MNQGLLGLAFGAGLVAALNPCGFALLPAYLTLVVRTEQAGGLTAVGRALAATVAMTLGLSRGLRRVRAAHRDDRGDRRALSALCDDCDRYFSCRTGYLAATRPRSDGADSAAHCSPDTVVRRPPESDRCSATGSDTPSRRCPARSDRSWRSPEPSFVVARFSTASWFISPTPRASGCSSVSWRSPSHWPARR